MVGGFFFFWGGGGAHGFQGEWRGDLSSPAEYKENSIENRQPVRDDHENTSDPLGDKVNFYCNTVIILTQTPQHYTTLLCNRRYKSLREGNPQ